MMKDLYAEFNARFTPEKYQQMRAAIEAAAGDPVMRLCEAPVFIDRAYAQKTIAGAKEIIAQSLEPKLQERIGNILPPGFNMPSAPKKPSFFIVDFAMTKEGPRLIELQAFASNLLFAPAAAKIYQDVYGFGGDYLLCDEAVIGKTVLGNHAPENVVLMEINPWQQPSRRDFIVTQKKLGIPVVDVTAVTKKGRELYYPNAEGKETRIRRIYNRVVPGEYQSLGLEDKASFHFYDDLDVEWAGDPGWFMRVSKYVLPYLSHPMVPQSWFLHHLSSYPADLENYVLKPAFLNAGIGVKLNLREGDINAINVAWRDQYLLMEKVTFDPFIPTPDGKQMCAELRAIFVWPDEGELEATGFTARVMRGNNVNTGVWGEEAWSGLAPVFIV